jgi:hypothetical protein
LLQDQGTCSTPTTRRATTCFVLCQSEFDRVHTENLACRIWTVLKEAHVRNAQV